MSNFSGERLREIPHNYNNADEHWIDVNREQIAFMARFGVQPLTAKSYRTYEMALIERNIPILTEHE